MPPAASDLSNPELEPRWGLTRSEFHTACGVADGDYEAVRRTDAFWRATEPSHKLIPFAAFATGGIILCIPLLRSVHFGPDPADSWTHVLGLVLTVYGGMILLVRTMVADIERASERFIEARVAFPGPIPSQWLPASATFRNFACRVAVAVPEREMIRTGQLAPKQLGPDPVAYIEAVERAANGRTKFNVRALALLERLAGTPR